MPVQPAGPSLWQRFSSLHTRTWSKSLTVEQALEVQRAEQAVRERDDASGLRLLHEAQENATKGTADAQLEKTVATAKVLSMAGGAVVGLASLGVMGAVACGLGAVAIAAEACSLAVKRAQERHLDETMASVVAGTNPQPENRPLPAPAVSAEERSAQLLRRHRSETEKAVLAHDSARVHELEATADREIGEARRVATVEWDYPRKNGGGMDTVYDSKHQTIYTAVGADRERGYLTALDPSGFVRWSWSQEKLTADPVLDGDGNVCIRTRGKVHLIDPSGKELWSAAVPASSHGDRSCAVGPDGTVYAIGDAAGSCFVTALKDGTEQWRFESVDKFTNDPQVLVGGNGTVYFTASLEEVVPGPLFGLVPGTSETHDYLVGLRPADGTVALKVPVDGWSSYVGASLAEGPDGTICACHGTDKLSAWTPEGQLRWTHTAQEFYTFHDGQRGWGGVNYYLDKGAPVLSHPPSFDRDGNVYLATGVRGAYPESYLLRLDPSDGHEVWNRSIEGSFNSCPHVGPDGELYLTTSMGQLRSFDTDGNPRLAVPVGELSWNRFAFGDHGEVYLNTSTQLLACQSHPPAPALGDGEQEPTSEPAPAVATVADQGEFVVIGGMKLRKHAAPAA